ncbi:proton channel OtopLc-like [Leguminivora glycinivorella]|uniref:proton channel OtopLc-like n=1 Tax=Leguminivora glycinivorella TaxID=1035111 RepID=UPI002010867C|nr:proton channel OtopLc-like [Leguminivora glycinivorella]
MTETGTGNIRKDLLDEIVNRKRMGDKKFHSETSLQHYDEPDDEPDYDMEAEADRDPGVVNSSVNGSPGEEVTVSARRRRTMSQPGPGAGNFLTASAARAARRRPQRSVNYAADVERNESIEKPWKVSNPGRSDDSGSNTPVGDRNNTLPYNGTYKSNGDVKSLNSYRLYAPANDMRGAVTPRKRSVVTMDAQSIRSVETHAPAPTRPEDNRRLTNEYMNIILSSIYAILLVTFGIIVYLSEPFVDFVENTSTYYTLALTSVGFIYHLYLIIDISRYKKMALQNLRTKGLHEQKIVEYFRKQEEEFGPSSPGTPGSEAFRPPPPPLIPLKHAYCFSQGRHSGSFYLKLGAAGFAMGHLVHSVLLIVNQVAYINDENVNTDKCVNYSQIAQDVFSPVYCFLQLYFVFKYSNVIILRNKGLASYAFMHIIGSSICFWINTIVRETMVALTIYAYSQYGPRGPYENATYTPASSEQSRFFDVSGLYNEECLGSTAIMGVIESFSPYLYPFSVEFNILIVAIYYIIWSSIGKCENEDTADGTSSLGENNNFCQIPTANEENDFTSNIVIHADCHASNRGMFMGLVLMVFVVGMLIIGFVFSSGGEGLLEIGYLMNDSSKLGLHAAIFIAAIFAYFQTRKLDINEHPISLLDDILLFICIPAFFLETVLSLVATITLLNVVKTVDLILMMIQVVLQTALLVDGLRRCSNSRKLRRTKPGRELLMFLIIANVGMWLLNTFSYKSPESLDERYAYYGKVTWTILGHISLPLIMFYRFHSSVCFVDMWDSAYKPGAEH